MSVGNDGCRDNGKGNLAGKNDGRTDASCNLLGCSDFRIVGYALGGGEELGKT